MPKKMKQNQISPGTDVDLGSMENFFVQLYSRLKRRKSDIEPEEKDERYQARGKGRILSSEKEKKSSSDDFNKQEHVLVLLFLYSTENTFYHVCFTVCMFNHLHSLRTHVRMHARTHARTHACTHAHTPHTPHHTTSHTHTHTHMHTHTHTHMLIHEHIHAHCSTSSNTPIV